MKITDNSSKNPKDNEAERLASPLPTMTRGFEYPVKNIDAKLTIAIASKSLPKPKDKPRKIRILKVAVKS